MSTTNLNQEIIQNHLDVDHWNRPNSSHSDHDQSTVSEFNFSFSQSNDNNFSMEMDRTDSPVSDFTEYKPNEEKLTLKGLDHVHNLNDFKMFEDLSSIANFNMATRNYANRPNGRLTSHSTRSVYQCYKNSAGTVSKNNRLVYRARRSGNRGVYYCDPRTSISYGVEAKVHDKRTSPNTTLSPESIKQLSARIEDLECNLNNHTLNIEGKDEENENLVQNSIIVHVDDSNCLNVNYSANTNIIVQPLHKNHLISFPVKNPELENSYISPPTSVLKGSISQLNVFPQKSNSSQQFLNQNFNEEKDDSGLQVIAVNDKPGSSSAKLTEPDDELDNFEVYTTIRYEPHLFYVRFVQMQTADTGGFARSSPMILRRARQMAYYSLRDFIFQHRVLPKSCFFLLHIHHERLSDAIESFDWKFKLYRGAFDRIIQAKLLTAFGISLDEEDQTPVARLAALFANQDNILDWEKPHLVRLYVNRSAEVRVELDSAYPRPDLYAGLKFINSIEQNPYIFDIVLSTKSMNTSRFIRYKTTEREHYDEVRDENLAPPYGSYPHPGPIILREAAGILHRTEVFHNTNSNLLQDVLLYNEKNELMGCTNSGVAFCRNGRWITPPLSSGCLDSVTRRHLLTTHRVCERVVHKNSLIDGEPLVLFNAANGIFRGIFRWRRENNENEHGERRSETRNAQVSHEI